MPGASDAFLPDSREVLVSFTVPGQAVGKQRPRPRAGGKGFYTPAKTRNYERVVAYEAQIAMRKAGIYRPFEGPLAVTVLVRVKPTASTPKAIARSAIEKGWPAEGKPDADNVLKAILDGMNKVVFVDDAQVTDPAASKIYAAECGCDITIRRATPGNPQTGKDPA